MEKQKVFAKSDGTAKRKEFSNRQKKQEQYKKVSPELLEKTKAIRKTYLMKFWMRKLKSFWKKCKK